MSKFIRSIFKQIETLDLFGQGVGIRYNKRSCHKTKLGGFATIIIWSLIIYQAYYILYELVYQENPFVLQQTNYIYQQEAFEITPKSFIIAVGIQDQNYQHYFGEGIYTVKAFQNIIQRNLSDISGTTTSLSSQKVEIQVERCSEKHFQIEESKQYFLHLPYKEMHCLSIENIIPPYIQGEFSANYYASIQFSFSKCEGSDCKDQTLIDSMLSRATLAVYISDTFIDVKERNKPFQSKGKNLFWTTGPNFEKDIFLSLINSKVVSDYSRISTTSLQIQQTITYSSDREIVLPSTSNTLFDFTIAYEKNKENIYQRKYLKLGSAFSQVGGFYNFLLVLGYLSLRRFSQEDLNHKLINEVFDVKTKSYQDQVIRETKQSEQAHNFVSNFQQTTYPPNKNQEDNTVTPNFKKGNKNQNAQAFFSNVSPVTQQDNQVQEKQPEMKIIRFNLLKYLWNVWRCWNCCKTTESILINQAANKIFDHLDLLNIIKKLIEVDKLKQLLLNEDQIKLFEYLPKPVLFLDDYVKSVNEKQENIDPKIQNKNEIMSINNDLARKQSFDNVKASYFNIIRKKARSIIDQKILKMLDPEVKSKINQGYTESQINQNPAVTMQNIFIKEKTSSPLEYNEEYEETISKLDDLNEIFQPKDLRLTQTKSIYNINRCHKSFKANSQQVNTSIVTDESKQSFHIYHQ